MRRLTIVTAHQLLQQLTGRSPDADTQPSSHVVVVVVVMTTEAIRYARMCVEVLRHGRTRFRF